MEKLRMTSPDLTEANISKLAELFPTVVTETIDEDGNPKRAIDFDMLRQELSDHVVEGPQERYQLDWPGKRAAAFAANAPIAKTLRPVREESVNFDTTKNLFIEGDNLEALKLLQESYLGKIKLIYIDPPYNTGNDFVYEDDFAESKSEYIARSGQVSDTGERLVANTESNGRFHSDWLSMMYPRLKLARNLLSSDGVILISIDDTEVANLREIMDEIFGRRNLVTQIAHKTRASVSNDKIISASHNHILVYARDYDYLFSKRNSIGLEPDLTGFSNPDDDPRGPWKSVPIDGPGGAKKGNPFYEFLGVEGYWRYSKSTMAEKHRDNLIIRTSKGLQQKYFLSQARESRKTVTSWWDDVGLNSTATRRLSQLMEGPMFDTPKPVELLSRMLELFTFDDREATVMDFFAGSGTLGHSVFLANAKDGGSRKFILVQLDEAPNSKSLAAKAGYKSIAAVARERLRRVGRSEGGKASDVGFRSFRIDSTNLVDLRASAENLEQTSLHGMLSTIKDGRSSEDLLFQVLLDWGLKLDMSINLEVIDSHEVFNVEDNAVLACFNEQLSESVITQIARLRPEGAIFLDSAFKSDSERINTEQIFREISPETEIKVV